MSAAVFSFRRASQRGFSLMETVIAIGILAILLTAFLGIFGPAMKGIRSSINVEEANRLTSALESELASLSKAETGTADNDANGVYRTAFNKGFFWIKEGDGSDADNLLFAYTYKGNPKQQRNDGTLEPYTDANGQAGEDYILQAAVRRRGDNAFTEDLAAIDSRVFLIKVKQLTFQDSSTQPGTKELKPSSSNGTILDPTTNNPIPDANNPDTYPEAVIAYTAEFFELPSTSAGYLNALQVGNSNGETTIGTGSAAQKVKPIFTRNLGVRR